MFCKTYYRFGRKFTLLSATIPVIIGLILVLLANSPEVLYVSRLLSGITAGMAYAAMPMYLGEISSDKIRGSIGTLLMVMAYFGILYVYAIGPYVSISLLAWILMILPVLFVATFIWLPESPYFLLLKDRHEAAEKSLRWLRKSEDVSEELKRMDGAVKKAKENCGTVKELFARGNRRSLIICWGMAACQQLCGSQAVIAYSQQIFEEVSSGLGGSESAIIMAVVQLVTASFSSSIVDRLGRRPLLLISTSGATICNTIVGLYFFLLHRGVNMDAHAWLPITTLMIFIISYTIGLTTVPFALLSELFPTNIKAIATASFAAFTAFVGFSVLKLYQLVSDELGMHVTFWGFAVLTLFFVIFVYFLIPETKGRPLDEILEDMKSPLKRMQKNEPENVMKSLHLHKCKRSLILRSLDKLDLYGIFGPQHHIGDEDNIIAMSDGRKAEVHQDALDHRLDFQQGEFLANAIAWPGRERKISKRMAPLHMFRQKSVRIKALGIRKDLRVSMEIENKSLNQCFSGQWCSRKGRGSISFQDGKYECLNSNCDDCSVTAKSNASDSKMEAIKTALTAEHEFADEDVVYKERHAYKGRGLQATTAVRDFIMLCTLIMVTAAAVYGWTSPTLPKLTAEDSPIPTTADQSSWIVAFLSIGGVIGPIISFLIVDRIGRKITLLSATFPVIIGIILVLVANSPEVLYASRLFCGTTYGMAYAAMPMYLGEISSDKIRGSIGTLLTVMAKFGILYAYAIGPYVSISLLAWILMILPVLFVATFIWLPESPYFLLLKDRHEAAEKSLRWLRKSEDVSEELKRMDGAVKKAKENRGTVRELFTRGNRRSVIICWGMAAAQQLCGSQAVIAYSQQIFEQVSSGLGGSESAIIMAVIQLVTASFSSSIVDRLGRRPLLLISTSGATICNTIVGLYFFLLHRGVNMDAHAWLPITAIMLFIIFYTVGLATVPFALLSELFPTNIKAIASASYAAFAGCIAFGVFKLYQVVSDNLGMYVTFWGFAVFTLFFVIFVYILIPETKGRPLDEILEDMKALKSPLRRKQKNEPENVIKSL
ncbi:uncharacterized protein LOC132259159 [Phlebotomus argentipes]|uniref:uncharacterized protein LOC132259159 n=1 Tax=Phlebotomus argentipes TaxID=94469 RepID=UPI0028933A55|nr:uncharacterized protein LOC132259159 [Phlebotomus argentipes]